MGQRNQGTRTEGPGPGARTRGPGPGPGSQNQGAVDPEGKTGTQARTDRAPRLENNQVQRGRDLGMTTDQKNGQRQVKRRKKLELLSEKINPLYMPQRNAIL